MAVAPAVAPSHDAGRALAPALVVEGAWVLSDARDQLTKVAVVFLLAGAIGFGVLEGNRGAKVAKGKSAPAFKVDKLSGGATTLDDFKGKVVMVTFWGTWCGPCKEELPELVKL